MKMIRYLGTKMLTLCMQINFSLFSDLQLTQLEKSFSLTTQITAELHRQRSLASLSKTPQIMGSEVR